MTFYNDSIGTYGILSTSRVTKTMHQKSAISDVSV